LSRPALVTVAVLAFVASWNAFLLPLLVLQNESLHTLPLGVQNFSAEHSQDTAGILAFTSLAMMPALLFFSFAERRSSAVSRARSRASAGQSRTTQGLRRNTP